jgi:hypothetical protein
MTPLFFDENEKGTNCVFHSIFSSPSWSQFYKTFYVRDKLERLLLASLTSLDYSLRIGPGAYLRVEHVKGSSL